MSGYPYYLRSVTLTLSPHLHYLLLLPYLHYFTFVTLAALLYSRHLTLTTALAEAEPPKPKAAKKRKQGKLDAAGNKPEVSVYAKAYNKVKAQFVRIR